MTRLFIVRHGQTEWSRDGRYTSTTDLELTAEGVEQAERLQGHLDPSAFGLILSSPRRRARQTAEIAGFTGVHEPDIDNDLVEWAYGDYEGRTNEEIHKTVPGFTIWTHPVPGGESAEQVSERLDRVVQKVRSSGVDQALCFGHGHALRALALRWLGFDLTQGVHFPLDTSTVSVLGSYNGLPALQRWNATP